MEIGKIILLLILIMPPVLLISVFLSGWHMRFRQHHLIREMLHK